jgi:hypothetical protein
MCYVVRVVLTSPGHFLLGVRRFHNVVLLALLIFEFKDVIRVKFINYYYILGSWHCRTNYTTDPCRTLMYPRADQLIN